MKKHNLVAQPSLSTDIMPPLQSLSAGASVLAPTVVPMDISATTLSQQLEAHKHLVMSLTRDLQATQDLRKPHLSTPTSKII